MTKPRIYSKRLYIVALPQGISGFRQPDVGAIVTGARKRRDLLYDWDGRLNISTTTFRLGTSRDPDFAPVGGIEAVETFLAANPWDACIEVTA